MLFCASGFRSLNDGGFLRNRWEVSRNGVTSLDGCENFSFGWGWFVTFVWCDNLRWTFLVTIWGFVEDFSWYKCITRDFEQKQQLLLQSYSCSFTRAQLLLQIPTRRKITWTDLHRHAPHKHSLKSAMAHKIGSYIIAWLVTTWVRSFIFTMKCINFTVSTNKNSLIFLPRNDARSLPRSSHFTRSQQHKPINFYQKNVCSKKSTFGDLILFFAVHIFVVLLFLLLAVDVSRRTKSHKLHVMMLTVMCVCLIRRVSFALTGAYGL